MSEAIDAANLAIERAKALVACVGEIASEANIEVMGKDVGVVMSMAEEELRKAQEALSREGQA